jgi:hypothetical protein
VNGSSLTLVCLLFGVFAECLSLSLGSRCVDVHGRNAGDGPDAPPRHLSLASRRGRGIALLLNFVVIVILVDCVNLIFLYFSHQARARHFYL